jgi:hypothetical protein
MTEEIFCSVAEKTALTAKGWVKSVVAEYGPIPTPDGDVDMFLLQIECPESDNDEVYNILGIPKGTDI